MGGPAWLPDATRRRGDTPDGSLHAPRICPQWPVTCRRLPRQQRNLSLRRYRRAQNLSTRNTFAGLEPGCDPLPIYTIIPAPGRQRPALLAYPQAPFPRRPRKRSTADRQAAMGNDPAAFFSFAGNPELKEFAHILAPDPAHPAAKPILDDPKPLAAASPTGRGYIARICRRQTDVRSRLGASRRGPLSAVSYRCIVKQFTLMTRTPLSARTQGSNLMAHILDTLEQAAQPAQTQSAMPVPGAFGPVGTHLVYLSGHDCDLCYIGGLFDLHWTVGGRHRRHSSGLADRLRAVAELEVEAIHRPSLLSRADLRSVALRPGSHTGQPARRGRSRASRLPRRPTLPLCRLRSRRIRSARSGLYQAQPPADANRGGCAIGCDRVLLADIHSRSHSAQPHRRLADVPILQP